jgi:hypothetical protein
VPHAGWNHYDAAVVQHAFFAVEAHDSAPLLDANELVVSVMRFQTDLFVGTQGHEHQLRVRPGIDNPAKIRVAHRVALDVGDVTVHGGLHLSPRSARAAPGQCAAVQLSGSARNGTRDQFIECSKALAQCLLTC